MKSSTIATISIVFSVVLLLSLALYFGIKALVKKCKEIKEEKEFNERASRAVESDESTSTKSIDDNNENSREESLNDENSAKSNSLSNKSTSVNDKSNSVLDSIDEENSTSNETTSNESSDKNISQNYNNYSYNYNYNYRSRFISDDPSESSYDNSRHFSDDKSVSYHAYKDESDHYATPASRKSNSTKMAHCCNKCRNTCAACHADAHSSGYRAYLCSSCIDDYGNLKCPVCGGRMSGSDQARLCFNCGKKYGNKCFKCS